MRKLKIKNVDASRSLKQRRFIKYSLLRRFIDIKKIFAQKFNIIELSSKVNKIVTTIRKNVKLLIK